MQNTPTYQDLENRIKVLETKIIELYSPAKNMFEAPWLNIFEDFDDYLFLFDSEHLLININSSALNLLKKYKNELFGKGAKELFPFDNHFIINRSIEEKSTLKKRFDAHFDLINKHFKVEIIPYLNTESNLEYQLLILKDNSEFHNAEAEIEEKISKLSGFLNGLPEGIIMIELNGKIKEINNSACEITGFIKNEAIGKAINDIFRIHAKYFNEDASNLIHQVLNNTHPKHFINNTTLLNKSGNLLNILFSVVPVKNESGNLEGLIISFIDVTEKYKKEANRKDQDERIKQLFENNKNQILSESKQKFIQRFEIINAEDYKFNELSLSDIIDAGSLQRLQDEFSYTYQIASIIFDNNGKQLTNISNFSNACQILKNHGLSKEQCVFYDSLIQPGNEKSIIDKKKCSGCNITLRTSPILSGGIEIGKWVIGFVNFSNINGQNGQSLSSILNISRSELRKSLELYPLPELIDIENTTSQLWQICKEISGLGYEYLKISKDLIEKKKIQNELIDAKLKAEESDRHKTAFLASMSHEIRTPMNAIIGFTDLLSDPEFSEEDKKEFIELICSNGEILLRLIDDIIDIAKIEANALVIEKSECRINKIINEVALATRDSIKKLGKENIDIKEKTANKDDNFTIITDPYRLQQIITNLVGNAQKFTTTGYIEIGYAIKSNQTTQNNDFYLQFYVKDTGIGIPEEKINLIFDRFRQADSKTWKKYGGSGLGLTISKKLVNLLGGDIWVNSVVGKGSVFYFTIPYVAVSANEQQKTPEYENNLIQDLKGKSILIAEDIDSNFNLLKVILSKSNANIFWAKDGQQAVDICRTKTIDLVLMDVKLPVLNGLRATERIKEMYKNLPVIAISAYATEEDKAISIAAGCNDYISKPIKKDHLIHLINKYLVI